MRSKCFSFIWIEILLCLLAGMNLLIMINTLIGSYLNSVILNNIQHFTTNRALKIKISFSFSNLCLTKWISIKIISLPHVATTKLFLFCQCLEWHFHVDLNLICILPLVIMKFLLFKQENLIKILSSIQEMQLLN